MAYVDPALSNRDAMLVGRLNTHMPGAGMFLRFCGTWLAALRRLMPDLAHAGGRAVRASAWPSQKFLLVLGACASPSSGPIHHVALL